MPDNGKKISGGGKPPLVIGITGGIASGKSTVAKMFESNDVPCFDADKAVHELLQSDPDTIAAIAAAFPASSDGKTVDRSVLAATITHHPEKLLELETILHPRVRAAELRFIEAAALEQKRAAVLDIPLLFETDAHTLCDVVIVVHASLDTRKKRAFTRAGMTEEKWQRLLSRQLTDDVRNPRATILIPTDAGEEETRRVVNDLKARWNL